MMSERNISTQWKQVNKPREIEGILDTYLIRPSGFFFVQIFKHLPVSPTQVSILGILAGWACGIFYYFSESKFFDLKYALLGGFFMWLHSAWDSADGQLARLTHRTSELGRFIDGISDNFSFIGIYFAILAGYCDRIGHFSTSMFLLGLTAGLTHSLGSSLTDFMRNLFLFYTQGRQEVVNEEPHLLSHQLRNAQTWREKFILFFARNHAVEQRRSIPSSHKLLKKYLDIAKENPKIAQEFSEIYSKMNVASLKGWALLGANSRKTFIVFSAFIFIFPESNLTFLGMTWYYIYELVLLTPWLIFMALWQSRIDRKLSEILSSFSKNRTGKSLEMA